MLNCLILENESEGRKRRIMRLLIDEKDLALLLEKKRDLIGNKVTVDTIIAGISFLLSVITASYDDLLGIRGLGIVLKTIFCLIGIVYCLKIGKDVSEMKKNKYDHEVLLKDIESLNMIQHNHSLVAIKNEKENSYLVYYDERWDCKLFLNYKTQDRNNEAALKEHVSADLNIDSHSIICNYITSRVQEKYSVSHQEMRIYNHRLYEMHVNSVPDEFKKDNFEINGKHYYWMTIEEMERDDNIREKNLEVVDLVKEYIK